MINTALLSGNKTTVSRNIIWQILVNAVQAKQKAAKLSYYYPDAYFIIAATASSIRNMPIGDRTSTDKQKTPNLRVSSCPTMVSVSMQLQGASTIFQLNMPQISAFHYANPHSCKHSFG